MFFFYTSFYATFLFCFNLIKVITPNDSPAIIKINIPLSIGAMGVDPPGFGGIGGANIIAGNKINATSCSILIVFISSLLIIMQFYCVFNGKYKAKNKAQMAILLKDLNQVLTIDKRAVFRDE